MRAADIGIGLGSNEKLSHIPLSDNNVKRRIDDKAEGTKFQLEEAVKESTFSAIQLDMNTDFTQYCPLLIFVRYIQNKTIKDEMLFSKE